ncbi:MAG: IucA/IucC family protein [Micromonosporaceae bacterium]
MVGPVTAAGPVVAAAAEAELALRVAAPELVDGFRAALPVARDAVARRVISAACWEGLTGPAEPAWSGERLFVPKAGGGYLVTRAVRHGFGRIEVTQPTEADPVRLLADLVGEHPGVAAEIADATVNLAIALARRPHLALGDPDIDGGLDADEQAAGLERLATEGHNLHPCARTRLGWRVPDVLAHDLEAAATTVRFVAVHRDLHIGEDVGDHLGLAELGIRAPDPARFVLTPVHAWQFEQVLRNRYADLIDDGTLVPLDDVALPAVPTAALRTLLLPSATGPPRYLKVSLDIQVTSTRRTISVASTRNGPAISALLERLLADDPECARVVLMTERAGSAVVASGGRRRDLAAIVRSGLSGRLHPDERVVPGGALYASSPRDGRPIVAEIVDRYGRTRRLTSAPDMALRFLDEYARLLLPPVLSLATRHGIGLEAHLQNCLPTFVGGVPHRLAVRDFAGLRIYPPRLPQPLRLWPGSVVVTGDVQVMRAKVAYTALQAHLGELVVRLASSHQLGEVAAWAAVRGVIDEVYERLRADPPLARQARADHAFFVADTVPHKALLTMRLRGGGEHYVAVGNPLR